MVSRFRLFVMLMVVLVCRGVAQTDLQTPYKVCGPSHSASQGPCATPPKATFGSRSQVFRGCAAEQDPRRGRALACSRCGWKTVNIKITRSIGHGLDQEAIDAVGKWKFEPATLDGRPVPVEINVEVNFRLYGKSGEPVASPSPPLLARQDANTLFANAFSAQAMNDCGSAVPLAIRVTEMYPRHNAAWNLLGLCYLELDELQEAEDAFRRQIDVSPQSTFAYNNLGGLHARQRKFDMAIAQFRKQIEINPRDRYAHMNLGGSLRLNRSAIPSHTRIPARRPVDAGECRPTCWACAMLPGPRKTGFRCRRNRQGCCPDLNGTGMERTCLDAG